MKNFLFINFLYHKIFIIFLKKYWAVSPLPQRFRKKAFAYESKYQKNSLIRSADKCFIVSLVSLKFLLC